MIEKQSAVESNKVRESQLFLLQTLHRDLTKIGIRLFDDRSLADFMALPFTKRQELFGALKQCEILPQERPITRKSEIDFLKKQLALLNLEPYDDVYRFIKEGDVIEVYSGEFFQLYRNWSFVKLCSYTYLDLLMRPFYELFDRPTKVTEAIIGRASEVLKSKKATIPWAVPDHLLQERLLGAKTIFKIELGSISPLKDTVTGQTKAFLSTLKASVLCEGEDSSKFAWF